MIDANVISYMLASKPQATLAPAEATALYFLSHQSRVARTREQTCELPDTPLTVDRNPFMTVNTEEGGGYLLTGAASHHQYITLLSAGAHVPGLPYTAKGPAVICLQAPPFLSTLATPSDVDITFIADLSSTYELA